MKRQNKLIAAGTAFLAITAISANAATVLVDEDWQGSDVANNTQLDDTTAIYPGWNFDNGTSNDFKSVDSPSNGLPGGAEGAANQAVQFEWADETFSYDTTHTWSTADEFTISFNATEMNWGNANDRTIVLSVKETNLTEATLWTQSFALPEYNVLHNESSEDWSAAQTFNTSFDASAWGGTAGAGLTLVVGAADTRGMYIDNINFSLADPIPEPSIPVIIGLGGLALLLRRRK